MPISDKNYALKILMAGVHVEDKEAFIEGLEELIDNGGTGEDGYITIEDVENKIQEIIGLAPSSLDTLEELSKALNNDPEFSTTIIEELNQKVTKKELETKIEEVYQNTPTLSGDEIREICK